MKYTQESFDGDNDLLAGVAGLRSPVHRTLDPRKVTAAADGTKSLRAGFWVAESGDLGRPLPRSKAASAVTTSDTVLTVENAQAFIPGDMVYIIPSSAEINLTGTWAAGNTLTIDIGGAIFEHTATSTSAAGVASDAADELNASASMMNIASAIADGDSLYILAADFSTPYSISVTAAGGSAAASVANSQSVLLAFRELGTIDAGGVSVEDKQLTLTGTAAAAVPTGMPIGTSDRPIGLHLRALDLEEQAVEVGLYTAVSLKKGALPYMDAGIAKLFPEIQLVGK